MLDRIKRDEDKFDLWPEILVPPIDQGFASQSLQMDIHNQTTSH